LKPNPAFAWREVASSQLIFRVGPIEGLLGPVFGGVELEGFGIKQRLNDGLFNERTNPAVFG
jgi:hypothetical protein